MKKTPSMNELLEASDAPKIKAIETRYNGYRFRSRLEARHAVFFDTLGIKYEYEKEGFELGDGLRYLPDFWLPQQKCWVEIKGDEPSDMDLEKICRFVEQSGDSLVLFIGEIEIPLFGLGVHPPSNHDRYASTVRRALCDCPVCGGFTLIGWCDCLFTFFHAFCNAVELIKGEKSDWYRDKILALFEDLTLRSPRLQRAYTAARSARFEHGEGGR